MAEQLSLGDKRGVAWGIDDGREPLDHRQRVLEVAGGRAGEATKSLPPGGPVAVSVHERFRCRLLIDALTLWPRRSEGRDCEKRE